MAYDDEHSRAMRWAAEKKNEVRDLNHQLAQQNQVDSWQVRSAHGDKSARNSLLWSGNAPSTPETKKVICTELHRQGRMSLEDYRLCAADAAERVPDAVYRGYHAWAVPAVRLMRASTLATRVLGYLAAARVDEIAARRGDGTRGSLVGKVLIAVGEPICGLLGRIGFKADHRALYVEGR